MYCESAMQNRAPATLRFYCTEAGKEINAGSQNVAHISLFIISGFYVPTYLPIYLSTMFIYFIQLCSTRFGFPAPSGAIRNFTLRQFHDLFDAVYEPRVSPFDRLWYILYIYPYVHS